MMAQRLLLKREDLTRATFALGSVRRGGDQRIAWGLPAASPALGSTRGSVSRV